jgi:hypothetical protein
VWRSLSCYIRRPFAVGEWRTAINKEAFMAAILSSPVPQTLREIFRDHPELIQEIQDGLNRLIDKPYQGTPIFEQAVWVLEDTLGQFVARARNDLSAAEQSGNAADIEKAKAKQALVFKARPKQVWLTGLDEFERYARTHEAGGGA